MLVIRLASGAPPVLTAARPSALPRTSPGALGPPFPSGVALPGAPLPVAPARALVVLTLDVPIARPAGEVRARRQASGKAQQGVDGPCARPDVCPTPSRPLCRLPRPARIPPHAPPCFRPPLPLPPAAVARRTPRSPLPAPPRYRIASIHPFPCCISSRLRRVREQACWRAEGARPAGPYPRASWGCRHARDENLTGRWRCSSTRKLARWLGSCGRAPFALAGRRFSHRAS